LDTREKIILFESIPSATAAGSWFLIAGLFDPLTADTADFFAEITNRDPDRRVLAVILDSETTNLPSAARAVLVAALRRVDLVAVGTLESLPVLNPDVELVVDPVADRQRSQQFVDLILQRQRAGS